MKGYCDDIERLTTDNTDFRRVLYTGKNLQLVLMTLQPGEEIGSEVHEDRDQFFRFEEGEGVVDIDGKRECGRGRQRRHRPRRRAAQCPQHEATRRSSSTRSTARPSIRTASSSRPRPKPTSATRTRNGTAGTTE